MGFVLSKPDEIAEQQHFKSEIKLWSSSKKVRENREGELMKVRFNEIHHTATQVVEEVKPEEIDNADMERNETTEAILEVGRSVMANVEAALKKINSFSAAGFEAIANAVQAGIEFNADLLNRSLAHFGDNQTEDDSVYDDYERDDNTLIQQESTTEDEETIEIAEHIIENQQSIIEPFNQMASKILNGLDEMTKALNVTVGKGENAINSISMKFAGFKITNMEPYLFETDAVVADVDENPIDSVDLDVDLETSMELAALKSVITEKRESMGKYGSESSKTGEAKLLEGEIAEDNYIDYDEFYKELI